MSISDETIEQIQQSIKDSQKVVALGEAVERLIRNKDFQEVIDIGYFTNEARRLTLLSADPEINEQTRAAVMRSIQAIGELHTYIQVIRLKAENAAKDVEFAKGELNRAQDDSEVDTDGSDAE